MSGQIVEGREEMTKPFCSHDAMVVQVSDAIFTVHSNFQFNYCECTSSALGDLIHQKRREDKRGRRIAEWMIRSPPKKATSLCFEPEYVSLVHQVRVRQHNTTHIPYSDELEQQLKQQGLSSMPPTTNSSEPEEVEEDDLMETSSEPTGLSMSKAERATALKKAKHTLELNKAYQKALSEYATLLKTELGRADKLFSNLEADVSKDVEEIVEPEDELAVFVQGGQPVRPVLKRYQISNEVELLFTMHIIQGANWRCYTGISFSRGCKAA